MASSPSRARRPGWLCSQARAERRRCRSAWIALRSVAGAIQVGAGREDLRGGRSARRRQAGRADGDCSLPGSAATRAGPGWDTVPSRIMGAKAERRAAREQVSAYHQARLAELLSHVAAAIDRYRHGEIDACETIHHYHRAAGQLWKFCFSRGGAAMPSSSPASSTTWPPKQKPSTGGNAPHRDGTSDHNPCRLACACGDAVADRGHVSPRLSAPSRRYGRRRARCALGPGALNAGSDRFNIGVSAVVMAPAEDRPGTPDALSVSGVACAVCHGLAGRMSSGLVTAGTGGRAGWPRCWLAWTTPA